jgi:hypothetical protein
MQIGSVRPIHAFPPRKRAVADNFIILRPRDQPSR